MYNFSAFKIQLTNKTLFKCGTSTSSQDSDGLDLSSHLKPIYEIMVFKILDIRQQKTVVIRAKPYGCSTLFC